MTLQISITIITIISWLYTSRLCICRLSEHVSGKSFIYKYLRGIIHKLTQPFQVQKGEQAEKREKEKKNLER